MIVYHQLATREMVASRGNRVDLVLHVLNILNVDVLVILLLEELSAAWLALGGRPAGLGRGHVDQHLEVGHGRQGLGRAAGRDA